MADQEINKATETAIKRRMQNPRPAFLQRRRYQMTISIQHDECPPVSRAWLAAAGNRDLIADGKGFFTADGSISGGIAENIPAAATNHCQIMKGAAGFNIKA